MKINKKGFTLVELIISIVLIAAIALAANLGLQKSIRDDKENQYRNDLRIVMSSSQTYIAMKNIDTSVSGKVTLDDVIASGNLDLNYLNKINGLSSNCNNFFEDTEVRYEPCSDCGIGGLTRIYMVADDNEKCYLDDIVNCNIHKEC